MAYAPRDSALADALRPLGEVTVVAPIDEASAIGHALTLRRPLRLEHDSRAASTRSTARRPTASTSRSRRCSRAARSGRLRHQQGLEPRRRRDLFGHRGGRARGGAARRAGHCRLAASDARRRTTSATPAQRGRDRGRGACCERPLPARTFLNMNVPNGQPKGFRVTVQAKRNHVTSVAERHDPKGGRTTGLRKGRTSGSRTTGRTTRRCATATSR